MNLPIKKKIYKPFALKQWDSLVSLNNAVTESELPDYTKQYAWLNSINLTVPDDPLAVGLDTIKALIATVSNLRLQVAQKRVDAIYLQAEWKLAQMVFVCLVEQIRATAMESEEFVALKNKESRDAYLQRTVNDQYLYLQQQIDISVSRCASYIEACRVMSAGLDAMYEGISRQFSIVEHQNQINKNGEE